MVIFFRIKLLVLLFLCFSCQYQYENSNQDYCINLNFQITDEALLQEISEYVKMIDFANRDKMILNVLCKPQCDGSQLYHISSFSGSYLFFRSDIHAIYKYKEVLVIFEFEGIKTVKLDSVSKLQLIKQWLPFDYQRIVENINLSKMYPDIDVLPPPTTGYNPIFTVLINDGQIIKKTIE